MVRPSPQNVSIPIAFPLVKVGREKKQTVKPKHNKKEKRTSPGKAWMPTSFSQPRAGEKNGARKVTFPRLILLAGTAGSRSPAFFTQTSEPAPKLMTSRSPALAPTSFSLSVQSVKLKDGNVMTNSLGAGGEEWGGGGEDYLNSVIILQFCFYRNLDSKVLKVYFEKHFFL